MLEKAGVLAEALPYIREFTGRTVVIKYGGHAMDDPALADLFAQDVVLMRLVGMNPVVVHGGGPQISDLMRRLGKEPEFVDGLRVTDAESVDIVRMALVGKVNREIVAALNQHGSYAVGLSGEDAGLIKVEMRDERLGFVGDVSSIDPSIVHKLRQRGAHPGDRDGRRRRARPGLQHQRRHRGRRDRRWRCSAEKLVYLTDVAGLYADYPDESTPHLADRHRRRRGGCWRTVKADGGMIPKLESCLDALRGGVRRAHILDGRIPHALLLEFFTREGIGTMIDATTSES